MHLSSRIVDTLIALRSQRKVVSALAKENYSADDDKRGDDIHGKSEISSHLLP